MKTTEVRRKNIKRQLQKGKQGERRGKITFFRHVLDGFFGKDGLHKKKNRIAWTGVSLLSCSSHLFNCHGPSFNPSS